ncbi:MAG: DUF6055 domain-containing protein [Bacteroidota bacterium]
MDLKKIITLCIFILTLGIGCSEDNAVDSIIEEQTTEEQTTEEQNTEEQNTEESTDPCADIDCQNGGSCIEGTCTCPDGFEGQFCETFIDPCADVNCQNGGTCVDGICSCPDGFEGEFCEQISGLSFQTEFGTVETLNVVTNDIFAIWWSPDFDHSSDTAQMFEYLKKVRQDCLTIYGLEDPPNPQNGFYYNVYIHHGLDETVLPTYWGNGQGTDTYGMPFLTLPHTANVDYANLSHEGFHIFQYNANSSGFEYSGDSQWYVESSAQWYMSQNVPNEINTFIEAGTIYANPHVALWHSFSNEAPGDPKDWFFQVRQYGMHLLLYYLTEEKAINPQLITSGYYANTSLLPQEYLFQGIGGDTFRTYFADWAARNSGGFDYFSQEQLDRAWYEMEGVGDSDNSNPYVFELTDSEADGIFSPEESLRPRGWAYNVIKINNLSNTTYTFTLNGETTGSEGANSHFEARVVIKNSNGSVEYVDFAMTDSINGTASIDVSTSDTEVYLDIVSVPEHFTGNQTYNYEIEINRD